jgi:hypothetical protein
MPPIVVPIGTRDPNPFEAMLIANAMMDDRRATLGNSIYAKLYPQGYRLQMDDDFSRARLVRFDSSASPP